MALRERRMKVTNEDFRKSKENVLYRKNEGTPEGLYLWAVEPRFQLLWIKKLLLVLHTVQRVFFRKGADCLNEETWQFFFCKEKLVTFVPRIH